MKVYRYMSVKELEKMSSYIDIVGRKVHKARTSSHGVCFLPEKICFEDSQGEKHEFSPEECYAFLRNIVSGDILVEFETTVEINRSYGIYADPICLDWGATICIDEYCTPSYNRDWMKPVRYKPVGEKDWYIFN